VGRRGGGNSNEGSLSYINARFIWQFARNSKNVSENNVYWNVCVCVCGGGGRGAVVVANSLSITHCLEIRNESSFHCLFLQII
jgi:hypothetical protein